MKLVKLMALGTVLALGMQHGAAAQDDLNKGNSYAGMEEIVVVARKLPAETAQEMEEIVVTGKRLPPVMEEIVVVAKRLRPSMSGPVLLKTAALDDIGQLAVRTPTL